MKNAMLRIFGMAMVMTFPIVAAVFPMSDVNLFEKEMFRR